MSGKNNSILQQVTESSWFGNVALIQYCFLVENPEASLAPHTSFGNHAFWTPFNLKLLPFFFLVLYDIIIFEVSELVALPNVPWMWISCLFPHDQILVVTLC